MLKIKLVRFGKKDQPYYRIVVQEARTKRDGKYTALLGQYAPAQTPKALNLDLDAYKEWMTKGAQPTDTVASLAKRYESGNPFPPKKAKPSKKQLAKQQAAEEAKNAPAPEAPAETPAEAPVEETPTEVTETAAEETPAEPTESEPTTTA